MSVHDNSKKAIREERALGKPHTRRKEILRLLVHTGQPFTDRQIMRALGYQEMNQVRPRITELVKAGSLRESGKGKCPVTGKTVRLVQAPTQAEFELDLAQCKRGVS
jgi:predicted HTH transcriptional regulator